MTKFQDELKTAIAEWHDAMNTQDIKYIRKHSGKKLESLINLAVGKNELRKYEYWNGPSITNTRDTREYPFNLDGEKLLVGNSEGRCMNRVDEIKERLKRVNEPPKLFCNDDLFDVLVYEDIQFLLQELERKDELVRDLDRNQIASMANDILRDNNNYLSQELERTKEKLEECQYALESKFAIIYDYATKIKDLKQKLEQLDRALTKNIVERQQQEIKLYRELAVRDLALEKMSNEIRTPKIYYLDEARRQLESEK